ADFHVVPEETRGAPAYAGGRGATHLYHVVGDQAVSARHQVERRLALADPALAEDEDAEAVHLHQVAVESRLRRHAVLEPGGRAANEVGGAQRDRKSTRLNSSHEW